jgi:hypothetical protein
VSKQSKQAKSKLGKSLPIGAISVAVVIAALWDGCLALVSRGVPTGD